MYTMTADTAITLFELIQKQLEQKGYTYNGAYYRESYDGRMVNPHTNGNIWVLVSPEGPNVYTINLMEDRVTISSLNNTLSTYSMTLSEAYTRRYKLY